MGKKYARRYRDIRDTTIASNEKEKNGGGRERENEKGRKRE